MGKVYIAVKPGERGHLNASLALMNEVRETGNEVTFFASRRDADLVRSNGFLVKDLTSPLTSEDFDCDLFIADQTLPEAAVLALYFGRPCIIFSTTLLPRPGDLPSWSGLGARRGIVGALLVAVEKGIVRPARLLRQVISSRSTTWGRALRALPRDQQFRAAVVHLKSLVTLIACPEAFDVQRASSDERPERIIHIGPCVKCEYFDDLGISAGGLPSKRIFASLGSRGTRSGLRISRKLISVLKRRPDWQLELSTGGYELDSLGDIPPNVNVCTFSDQRVALGTANVFVTHCGLNSVKEAICLGVPMIGIPIRRDQPSIAARIRYHGLGTILNRFFLSSANLERAIEAAFSNQKMKESLLRMRQVFHADHKVQIGGMIIDMLILSTPSNNRNVH